MDGHTIGPTDPKLGTEDHLCPAWEGLRRVKVGIRGRSRGRERFSAWREAPARQFGLKMSRRASLRNKQSQNLAPSMDESE